MNLANRPPPGLKGNKSKPDPAYLARVRELPCIICREFGELQLSPTTAHHPIHDRHGTRKRSDRCAIPLCDGHHQSLFDNSKVAIHRAPAEWRERYGADHEWIERIQDILDSQKDTDNDG